MDGEVGEVGESAGTKGESHDSGKAVTPARPVAVVTGAGSGLGAAVAVRLAARHDLVLTHLEADEGLADTVERATRAGADVLAAVVGDLTHQETVAAFDRAVRVHRERLEVLVCNAGAYEYRPWSQTTGDDVRRAVDVNLIAHMACVRSVSPHLVVRGFGRIVAVSTVLTRTGRVELVPYIAAKGGLEAFVRALARELGPHGITVNSIRPGSIELSSDQRSHPDYPAWRKREFARQCMQRHGSPDDVAAAVEFLVSQDAGFITGQSLAVDGGWHLD
ncbi:SDR family NAD(P)-dependent oxidoreductase [Streptomyces sp. NPDC017979]|uniref:SDR family NAD(P)-dependent oxidoreductase n=1 Tax=Streptomyces sp. NPDC017979 TaxID=3365024 RepID=UPI0037B94BAD